MLVWGGTDAKRRHENSKEGRDATKLDSLKNIQAAVVV